jgi:hypothetical protein
VGRVVQPTSREQCPKSSDAVGLLADRCAQIVQDLPSHADLGSGGALDGLDAALSAAADRRWTRRSHDNGG